MNTENDMNEEVRQLLDSLEEHGKNARRQQKLSDLIDRLAEKEKTVELPQKRGKLTPLWWAMGAAAAVLLLWLIIKPNMKQAPNMEKQNLVEKVEVIDSVKAEKNDVVIEESVVKEELLAEGMPVVPQKPRMKNEKPQTESVEEVIEQPALAEVIPTKPEDTATIGSNNIPTVNETPSAVQKPQRRVIRSLNLVCYECRKEPEHEIGPKPNVDNRTLFGQPQDPNMKNGALAFEFKLN
jgi:hypothetical protein